MNFIRIIIFLAVISPFMAILSGCYNDAFLDAIHEEEDFISPFDVVVSTEEAKRTTYFPIPDTGSVVSVMEGDDASINNIPEALSYTESNIDNGGTAGDDRDTDDIVLDNVTGLTWTKCSATEFGVMDTYDDCRGSKTDKTTFDPDDHKALMEWSKAVSTCKNLAYAGHKDWRLPRLPELLTIVNYGFHPAIDPSVFPNSQGSYIPDLSLDGGDNNYTFITHHYTTTRYSVDTRDRYIKETNGSYTLVPFTTIEPLVSGDPGYTAYSNYILANYIKVNGEYILNSTYQERYMPDDSGTYLRLYIPVNDIPVANRYNRTAPATYVQNDTGNFLKIGIEYIPFGTRYDYNSFWGMYLANPIGEFIYVYIPDNEDHFKFNGENYVPGNVSDKYVRAYTLDTRTHYKFTGTYVVDSSGTYVRGDYGKYFKDTNNGTIVRYKFNGVKYVVDSAGRFIQEFDAPVGYWTYSSKLMVDDYYNTAEYSWIVFHQGGGTWNVNINSFKLKVREDLSFEKQFVRCVRGGDGDNDDIDF